MSEFFISTDTLPDAYHKALITLNKYGSIVPCPDWGMEQKEISLTMEVKSPLKEPMISKLFIGGFKELEQYTLEIVDGILDFEVSSGKWAYTYHKRIEGQIPFIIAELQRNPYSRRAVIDVRDWNIDSKISDPACMQHIQYFIRDNKLHCKVLFRSNDAAKATFMNAFALIMLQQKIANKLGCEIGTYTHRANSFHCYSKDFSLLDGYYNKLSSGQNNTYSYIDDWKELMEESKCDILNNVKILRERNI